MNTPQQNIQQQKQQQRPHRRHRRTTFAGFTLVELLVAIGAVSILAVGIATIFASISSTVRGGQRVSRLTQQAAAIEARLRQDFANLATDGVLVMRHAYANDASTGSITEFPLAPSSPQTSRLRRSDQLVYTVRGTETTARVPLPRAGERRLLPTSDTSLVYLGHGLRWDNGNNTPEADDYRTANSNPRPAFGDPLNSEARRWMLLRRPILLATPAVFETGQRYADNAIQIGAQPAAFSIFRYFARNPPTGSDLPREAELFRRSTNLPNIASGLTDIATTSLAEIVKTIRFASYSNSIIAGQILYTPPLGDTSRDAQPYVDAHRWMEQLFPISGLTPTQGIFEDAPELRMRYEPEPPDIFGTRANSGNVWPINRDYRLADQLMLSASNFVPNCSEFIVEWSFGETIEFPAGSNRFVTLWHGRDRTVDGNTVAVRYGGSPSQNGYTNLPLRSTTVNPIQNLNNTNNNNPLNFDLNPRVVHGIVPSTSFNEFDTRPIYSFFGPINPLWIPPTPNQTDWPAEIPMPWPSMIRITMTLADPQDDTIEQTFQFIFDLPRR